MIDDDARSMSSSFSRWVIMPGLVTVGLVVHHFGPYRIADLATEMAPTVISTKINIRFDLVGDTGIEPVTSSV